MNWFILKHLYKIYQDGKTKANKTLLKDPDIEHLLNHTKELFLHGNFIRKKKIFDKYYETHHLDKFREYEEFLQRNNLEKPQTRFAEKDIIILISIEKELQNKEIREKDNNEDTIKFISTNFFKDEKYLLNQESLRNAVLQLIKNNQLPPLIGGS